ncbi:MAG: DUF3788 domain-containing protein [Treponema sp.]|nr:DUF3788 domain-containing protein [Treponema sp.]
MENQLLKDPKIKPNKNTLEEALGKKHDLFMEFTDKLKEQNLIIEWNYYNDGKSWLGKLLNKKKNLCWISIWDTGFKVTVFFTEKTISGFYELKIDEQIKNTAKNTKQTGKLMPVILSVGSKKHLNDCLKILEYKKQLK